MMNWSDKETTDFIEMYRERRLLWDSTDSNYKNKLKRHDGLMEIALSLGIEKSEVEKKIKNLQSQFARERKRENMSRKSATGAEKAYSSKWFAYSSMMFLAGRKKPENVGNTEARGAALNKQQKQIYGAQQETMQDAQCSQVNRLELDDSNQDPLAAVIEDSNDTEGFENDWYDNNDGAKAEDEMNIEEPQMQEEGTAVNTRASPLPVGAYLSQSPQPTHPTIGLDNTRKSSLKRKRGLEDDDLKVLDNALKLLQSSTDVSHDPYYTYGLHIANELRKYDSQTLAHVKRAFADIMFKADMGQLFDSNPQYSRRFVPHNSPRTSSHPQEQNGCTSPEIKRIFLPVPSELDQDIILP